MNKRKAPEPWQLRMFRQSLKKQLKMDALLALLGEVDSENCLLITCGDNNGALNWVFREHGGRWTWADIESGTLAEMSRFLGEPVHQFPHDKFPLADSAFDCVVSIDVLEHLEDDKGFLAEVNRVLRPGGRAIVTVPNGDPALLANRIKWAVGMTPEAYGHTRAGYTLAELRESVAAVGLTPKLQDGYSRFFTEMMELIINFGYVFVLSRKSRGDNQGKIAPTTSTELKTHGLAYRLYSLVFPIMKLFSQLDRLLPSRGDNAVIVLAEKVGAAS